MNGSRRGGADLVHALAAGVTDGAAEMLVCPPFVYLTSARQWIGDAPISLGAQNLAAEQGTGAFTGEVSGAMLADIGCRYAIVGHSERRTLYGETDAIVAGQVNAVVDALGVGVLADAVVAYEPIWAIGTGRTATPDQAQAVHAMVRELIANHDAIIAGSLRILYGGSVKGSNAKELLGQPDIDGGLVGGASLDAADFLAIFGAADF